MPRKVWLFRRRDRGCWYGGWYGPDGRRHQKSLHGLSKGEAAGWCRELERQLNAGLYVDRPRVRWSDFWADYTSDAAWLQKAAGTRALESACQRTFLRVCRPLWLDEVSTQAIRRFRTERFGQVSPATVNKEMRMLRAWLARAVEAGLLASSPAAGVGRLKEAALRPRVLSWSEFRRLRSASAPRLQFLMDLLWYTGMRISEALALTWRQVDFEAWTIEVRSRKTGKVYLVPIHPAEVLRSALSEARLGAGRSDRVFHWTQSGLNTTWGRAARRAARGSLGEAFEGLVEPRIWRQVDWLGQSDAAIEPALRSLGLEPTEALVALVSAARRLSIIRRHDFRSSFATHMLAAGVSGPLVQVFLGHSSYSTTQKHYKGDLSPALREAISRLQG